MVEEDFGHSLPVFKMVHIFRGLGEFGLLLKLHTEAIFPFLGRDRDFVLNYLTLTLTLPLIHKMIRNLYD